MTSHRYILKSVFAAGLLSASLAAFAKNPTQQPISTHFARTQSDISMELTAHNFSDVGKYHQIFTIDWWNLQL